MALKNVLTNVKAFDTMTPTNVITNVKTQIKKSRQHLTAKNSKYNKKSIAHPNNRKAHAKKR